MKLLTVCIFSILIWSCDDCYTYANKFRAKSYNFVLDRKATEEARFSTFYGKDSAGFQQVFREVAFTEMYELAQSGDTIIKLAGSTDVKLITKDTSIVYHYYCSGQPLK